MEEAKAPLKKLYDAFKSCDLFYNQVIFYNTIFFSGYDKWTNGSDDGADCDDGADFYDESIFDINNEIERIYIDFENNRGNNQGQKKKDITDILGYRLHEYLNRILWDELESYKNDESCKGVFINFIQAVMNIEYYVKKVPYDDNYTGYATFNDRISNKNDIPNTISYFLGNDKSAINGTIISSAKNHHKIINGKPAGSSSKAKFNKKWEDKILPHYSNPGVMEKYTWGLATTLQYYLMIQQGIDYDNNIISFNPVPRKIVESGYKFTEYFSLTQKYLDLINKCLNETGIKGNCTNILDLAKTIVRIQRSHWDYIRPLSINEYHKALDQARKDREGLSLEDLYSEKQLFENTIYVYQYNGLDYIRSLENNYKRNAFAAAELGAILYSGIAIQSAGRIHVIEADMRKSLEVTAYAVVSPHKIGQAFWNMGFILEHHMSGPEAIEEAKGYYIMAGDYSPAKLSLAHLAREKAEKLLQNGKDDLSADDTFIAIGLFRDFLRLAIEAMQGGWFMAANAIGGFINNPENKDILEKIDLAEYESTYGIKLSPKELYKISADMNNPWSMTRYAMIIYEETEKSIIAYNEYYVSEPEELKRRLGAEKYEEAHGNYENAKKLLKGASDALYWKAAEKYADLFLKIEIGEESDLYKSYIELSKNLNTKTNE